MPANSVVRARIDDRIKNEATAVLAAMGLTISDAVRLLLVRVANDKALPFEPLAPNAETIEAMTGRSRRRSSQGRLSRKASGKPECGRLGTHHASNATIAAKNPAGTASGLTPC